MVKINECTITTSREGFINITASINEEIASSGIKNGIVVVESKHSTSSILKITSYGNEVLLDIAKEIRNLLPARINFQHQDAPEDAAGHIKSSLFGSSVSLILKDGKLICDQKQDIYFVDYDGPRQRTYTICVMGE